MRTINNIVIHCTATVNYASVDAIKRYWKQNRGWKYPGYHYMIDKYGTVHNLLPEELPSNGVKGHNHDSVHVSYIGGVDGNGKTKDTRTELQKYALASMVYSLKVKYPGAQILGHRDFEGVHKDCPSFDVKKWLKQIGL